MATLAITNTFTTGTTIIAAEVNTNFTDISSYINARNNGTTDWDFMSSAGLVTAKDGVRSSDENATAPAYSFTSDTDTGLFRSTTNTLDLSTGGTTRFTLNTTGLTTTLPFLSAAGTASAPTYTFSGDNNTGMYNVGANVIGFSTGTVNAFTIAETQTRSLSGSTATPSISFIDDTNSGMYNISADRIGIAVNGADSIDMGTTQIIYSISGTREYQMTATALIPDVDNVNSCGTAGKRWSDLRSVLINGADYGFANGWFIREYPATFKDAQTQPESWFQQNANKGLQIVNDKKELVMVIGEDGTLYAKQLKALTDLDSGIRANNITSPEDQEYEVNRRKEIRGEA